MPEELVPQIWKQVADKSWQLHEQQMKKAPKILENYAFPREVSLTTQCTECKAEMHGTWIGNPPYRLVCGVCGASYTVTMEEH